MNSTEQYFPVISFKREVGYFFFSVFLLFLTSNICFQFLTGYMKNLFSKEDEKPSLLTPKNPHNTVVCKVEMSAGHHLVKRTINQPCQFVRLAKYWPVLFREQIRIGWTEGQYFLENNLETRVLSFQFIFIHFKYAFFLLLFFEFSYRGMLTL